LSQGEEEKFDEPKTTAVAYILQTPQLPSRQATGPAQRNRNLVAFKNLLVSLNNLPIQDYTKL